MTSEDEVQALISVENGTTKVSVLIPNILLDTILRAYKKKVGATREYGLKSNALFYFAALGVLTWLMDQERGSLRPGHPRLPDPSPKRG